MILLYKNTFYFYSFDKKIKLQFKCLINLTWDKWFSIDREQHSTVSFGKDFFILCSKILWRGHFISRQKKKISQILNSFIKMPTKQPALKYHSCVESSLLLCPEPEEGFTSSGLQQKHQTVPSTERFKTASSQTAQAWLKRLHPPTSVTGYTQQRQNSLLL